ncbi:MAG: hypothetical protein HY302_12245 [Opitutae bacterium]|nr:hypothetical protein [Opitutae bacterium]
MGRPSHARCPQIFRPALAAGCILLVLALGVFAQNAALHCELHDAEANAHLHDGCVIDLFAHGVSLADALAALPPADREWQEARPAAAPEFFVESPGYLLRPERGPPAA